MRILLLLAFSLPLLSIANIPSKEEIVTAKNVDNELKTRIAEEMEFLRKAAKNPKVYSYLPQNIKQRRLPKGKLLDLEAAFETADSISSRMAAPKRKRGRSRIMKNGKFVPRKRSRTPIEERESKPSQSLKDR